MNPEATNGKPADAPTPEQLLVSVIGRLQDPRIELATLRERVAVARFLQRNGRADAKDLIDRVLDGEHLDTPDEAKRRAAAEALLSEADAATWRIAYRLEKAHGLAQDLDKRTEVGRELAKAVAEYKAAFGL